MVITVTMTTRSNPHSRIGIVNRQPDRLRPLSGAYQGIGSLGESPRKDARRLANAALPIANVKGL